MCGEHGHSIDYDAIHRRMSLENRRRLDDASAKFEELCASGVVFAAKPLGPLSINDFAEM